MTITGDPGRVELFKYVAHDSNGKLVNDGSLFTRREMYHTTGVNKHQNKVQDWSAKMGLGQAWLEMSQTHCKTSVWNDLVDGANTVLRHRDALFDAMLKKCWERANLDLYSKKQSFIATKVNGLQDPTKPDILIVYGDGNFPSGKKFERYVPVKGLKQSIIKRHKNSAEASEFKSSSVCPDCDAQLLTVAEWFNGRYYEVRGLKWCSSNSCKSKSIKHRDRVGAINIYRRHMGIAPPIMERNSGLPWLDTSQPQNYQMFHPPGQRPPAFLRRRVGR